MIHDNQLVALTERVVQILKDNDQGEAKVALRLMTWDNARDLAEFHCLYCLQDNVAENWVFRRYSFWDKEEELQPPAYQIVR